MNPEDLPLPARFVAGFLTQAVPYFLFIGLVFMIFHRWGARAFASRRIENPGTIDQAQLLRETRNSLLTMFFSGLLPVVILGSGVARVQQTTEGWEPWQLVALWFALLILNDAWFYVTHRLLHSPWLFKHVHSVHHRSVAVSPFTTYSFHPLEGLLLTAWVIPVLFFVPVPMPLFMSMQIVGLANNLNAHLGYELMPKWFIRVPPFKWFTSSTFHNLHHGQVNGNYGLMLRVWDTWFGTERPEYAQRFVQRGEKEAARPAGP
ncbi:MAG: sterol desaturase family protein [Archangium sp.]